MTKRYDILIKELELMKKYPKEIFYRGNTNLLNKRKISIVGTRKPNTYTKQITYKIASDVIYNNKLKYTRINLNGEF